MFLKSPKPNNSLMFFLMFLGNSWPVIQWVLQEFQYSNRTLSNFKCIHFIKVWSLFKEHLKGSYTNLTTSLVAKAKMSAQETLFRQLGTLSTACFALITVSNPSPASERLSELSFSAVPFLENNNTEASHPYISPNIKTTLTFWTE